MTISRYHTRQGVYEQGDIGIDNSVQVMDTGEDARAEADKHDKNTVVIGHDYWDALVEADKCKKNTVSQEGPPYCVGEVCICGGVFFGGGQ